MKISNISYKPPAINFSSTQRTTYRTNNNNVEIREDYNYEDYYGRRILNSNCTSFFRKDLYNSTYQNGQFTRKKINSIISFFDNTDKVNVYDFACSDGSEAYSLALSLIKALGEEEAKKKFFPIKASDIDSQIIKNSKTVLNISSDDLDELFAFDEDLSNKYYSIYQNRNQDSIFPFEIEPKRRLTSNIQFSKKNAINGLKRIKTKNNLILLRNFWPYLSKKETVELCKALCKLDESSLVVIGNFDLHNIYKKRLSLPGLLETCGFKPLNDECGNLVWKKVSNTQPEEEELSQYVREKGFLYVYKKLN